MTILGDGRDTSEGRKMVIEGNSQGRFRIFNTMSERRGVGVNLNREEALILAEELLKYLEETE